MKKINETALNKAGNVTNLLIQWLGKTSFQIEVPDLIQLITEDRLTHPSGPIQFTNPLHE